MTKKERAERLSQELPRIYPDAHCELDFKNPLELLVATILSAEAGQEGAKQALRVAVLAGGCSGFQYRFELDAAPQDDDVVIEKSGAKVFVDPASLELLAGAELDYTDELMGSHFTIRNPNATSSCGCGTSFSVD